MAEAMTAAPKPPVLNPLQRAWLRELGMEKVWLRQDEPRPPVSADAAPAGATTGTPEAAERPGSGPGTHAPASVASQAAAGGAAGSGSASGGEAVAGRVPGTAPSTAAAARASAAAMPGDASPAHAENGPPHDGTAAPQARPAVAVPRPGKPPAPAARGAQEEAPQQPPPTLESLSMLDMGALREQVLACTACGLCRGRRQAVFGMGAERARWLVVGEAPGEQEDRQGLPFVGRSGQLLDAMLAAVGMSRERDVYIANVIKCRPPGNRNPKPEEIAACRPYLMRQIALLKPERILVLGRFAAQTLLETDAAIGSLRGRVHTLKTEHGDIPMVVSYHPAYLLRSPGEKARAWQDLRLAADG